MAAEVVEDGRDRSASAWSVVPGTSTDVVVGLYRTETSLANAVIESTPLEAPPSNWPDFFGDWRLAELRAVLLHVITETACHAGHLDAARDLIDGGSWLVLGEAPGTVAWGLPGVAAPPGPKPQKLGAVCFGGNCGQRPRLANDYGALPESTSRTPRRTRRTSATSQAGDTRTAQLDGLRWLWNSRRRGGALPISMPACRRRRRPRPAP